MLYPSLCSNLIKLNKTDRKVNQSEIGKILGISKQGINSRITRNQEFSLSEIEKIYNAYNIRKEEVQRIQDEWLGRVKNELINSYNAKHSDNEGNQVTLEPLTASCGGGITVSSNFIYDYDANSTYNIVMAIGNSMEPTISDGSICVVKSYKGEQIKDNAIYFFSYGDESYIKRLAKNINEIVIMSDNKRYSDIVLKGDELDKIKIYGEVVKNMRDF